MAYVNKITIQTPPPKKKTVIKTITKIAVKRKPTGSASEINCIGKFSIGQDFTLAKGQLPSEIFLMPCSNARWNLMTSASTVCLLSIVLNGWAI